MNPACLVNSPASPFPPGAFRPIKLDKIKIIFFHAFENSFTCWSWTIQGKCLSIHRHSHNQFLFVSSLLMPIIHCKVLKCQSYILNFLGLFFDKIITYTIKLLGGNLWVLIKWCNMTCLFVPMTKVVISHDIDVVQILIEDRNIFYYY